MIYLPESVNQLFLFIKFYKIILDWLLLQFKNNTGCHEILRIVVEFLFTRSFV